MEGIPLDDRDKSSLLKEEDIYSRLVQAAQAKGNTQSHLQDIQDRYDYIKTDFNVLVENLEKAKLNYSQAQYVLAEYLNPKNEGLSKTGIENVILNNQTSVKFSSSTQVKDINIEDKMKIVNTGIGKHTDKYVSIGSAAGLGYLFLRKKRKQNNTKCSV